MLSIAKVSKNLRNHPISKIVSAPSYTAIKINTKAIDPDYQSTHFSTIDQTKLTGLVKTKDLKTLHKLNGVEGLAKALETNLETGINGPDLERRKNIFGSNTYKKPPPKGFFYFVVEAFKDTTIIILLGCAALSLGFGMKEDGAKEGWYEGGSIFVAVFLVIAVSAVSNFRQERQFEKLSKISNNIKSDAVRDGRRQKVSIFDIVVGDVVILNIGDQIPADGVFINGHSLLVDESSMTGESDHIEVDSVGNPFLISGSKVADGYGQMMVVSVGMNTGWAQMMSSITGDTNEQTPLQARLNKLTSSIGKVGLAVAFLVLVVMLIRYFTGNTEDENGNKEYNKNMDTNDILNSVTRIFAAAVTIVVVAIPEGLPLAVTLTLAYSMKRMMVDQAMVRKLSACETMGSATVICTDKTGTLTMNQMKVTEFWLGLDQIEYGFSSVIASKVVKLFHQGVGLNTTGSIYRSASRIPEYSGSPTEKAILSWAVNELGLDIEKLKQDYLILQVETFNSEKKRSGVSVRKKEDDMDHVVHVHWKGAAEVVLAMCSGYYDKSGVKRAMGYEERGQFERIIKGMAASSLRCIAFAHCESGGAGKRLDEEGLVLLGVVGIKDPCRPGAKKAIETCRAAGVEIKMITGDNVFTAKAIATECGILEPSQQVRRCDKGKEELSEVFWPLQDNSITCSISVAKICVDLELPFERNSHATPFFLSERLRDLRSNSLQFT